VRSQPAHPLTRVVLTHRCLQPDVFSPISSARLLQPNFFSPISSARLLQPDVFSPKIGATTYIKIGAGADVCRSPTVT
ncbi:MAG TPA: hypothetical protein PLB18_11835, partial [Acidobacteriota bacterium]|nr:hypothetical protein [Acidobacteriota bacterium]